MALGKLERALYRSLLRLGRQFDRPVLKALVCRNHGAALPAGLDAVVARFLGGAHYYWPSPGPQPRVLDAVQDAFRRPLAGGGGVEDAFAGVRYLSGLLGVARKHKLLKEAGQRGLAAASSAAGQQQEGEQQQEEEQRQQGPGGGEVELAAAPGRGLVLLAHPCLLGSIFSRSVVLLCRHEAQQGAYGLVVNKPLGSSLKHLHERFRQLHAPGGGGVLGGGGGVAAAGGLLFGGGGAGMGAGAGIAAAASPAPAAELAAAGREAADGEGDIPAQHLQAAVDWQQGGAARRAGPGAQLADDVAALQAALQQALALSHLYRAPESRSEDVDEHGNWIEAPYESAEEEEEEEEEGSCSEDEYGFGAEDDAEEAEGAGSGDVLAARGGGAGRPVDIASLLAALRGPQEGEGADVELVPLGKDASGVVGVLDEALRRAGGGVALVVDPSGQVWAHSLPQGDYAPQDEDENSEEEGEEAEGVQAGRLAAADEGPSAVADLLLRSLTAKDRVLLAAQQQAAQRQRQQRQQPEQAGEQQGEVAGGGAAAGMLGSAAAAAAAAADPASKVQRFRAEVQRLLDSVSALHPPRGGQQQEPLAATDSGSSLFGTGGSPAAASSSALGAGGSGRAAAAPGSGPGDSGSRNAATLSQLMTLFADSPLPRLGGELVLAPSPPRGSSAAASAEGGAAGAGEEALEGGIVVGADLSRAQGLVQEGYLGWQDVRVCMGDAAWSPGQLEEEVARGTWAVVRADPAFLDLFGAAAAQASSLEVDMSGSGSASTTAAAAAAAAAGGSAEGGEAAPSAAQVYEDAMWSKCLTALGGEYAELARVPRGVWADLAELEV
ncbi:hypothetical protein CHLNCDRAFT_138506 [Chlorella variabilis]|uniref:Uncharacterized protein n=1 Tax=Chlorella variabilis TaxID=554065 RepID=E1ZN72_CHLVA|nr:hypothetical protein CHLNCDRAFT_138506 [Chlorella variabilis]EFN52820.1 hypothetical protein CHLNCDRAFT_138506 [Chlorella variabilis]|eukprot:XP_005844922.1 hypothetical protein CHLNCDRAFT_138506 [Chlorella variabilis]